jgi:hypothetical protein
MSDAARLLVASFWSGPLVARIDAAAERSAATRPGAAPSAVL